ncbi:MAG TPA: MipA/OmpV family protein [Usitatibacteraceae bacterium]|nr:MipA/OmpV family protein [Usitatibacteraceae bacterium]
MRKAPRSGVATFFVAMPVLASAAVLASGSAFAQGHEEPLWEAGAGVAALRLPDYRGASHSRWYALPLPYLVYRGDFLKADRHGVRGVFFDSDRVEFNLSVGASLPVDSSQSEARQGMPDLRPSVELGPSVDFTLWRSAARRAKVELRLPLRGAVTIESDPRYIGVQFFPHLSLDVNDVGGLAGWNLGMLAGPVYTDRRYNRYFYGVPPDQATAARPAYDPDGGYGGAQFIVALSRRFARLWVGGYLRQDTLAGATFAASPLVTSRRYMAGGIGVSWIFSESSRRVPAND